MEKHFSFSMPLGDMVEVAAKPIAKALHLSCLDENGNLRPESGCAKRRDALNRRWKPPVNTVDKAAN